MRGKALLLGSETGALSGVSHDVSAMAAWLDLLGFSLDLREGRSATREGMLDGLARLVHDTRQGEAAVVYYSGHGGFVTMPPRERFGGGRFAPRAFQYLVPTDHDKLRSFRGVFRAELSSAVRELSDRTSNITVILDCCHSTDMVRNDDLVLKAVVEPWSEGIEAHVAWLVEQGYELDRLPELRSRAMVLVSACTVMQKAYEYTRPSDRRRHGLFTDRLLDVARRAHEPTRVTWDALIQRVAARIRETGPRQRPQVSGPRSRCLFSERKEHRGGALTLQRDAGPWRLSGGWAAGVVRGDRYAIVDPLAEDPSQSLAEVEVSEVEGHAAVVTVAEAVAARLKPGMLAVPRPGGPTHQWCRVDGTGPLAELLRRRVAEVPGLEVVDAVDVDGRGDPAFMLIVRDRAIDVLDPAGKRLRRPWLDVAELDPSLRDERLDGLIGDLRGLTRASDLLSLARREGNAGHPRALAHAFEWGVVDGGVPRPLPHSGAELTVGDRIYVSVENLAVRPIHVSLLDVGVSRTVTVLNRNEPEGVDLGAGETEVFGMPELRSLQGIELVWPDDVPPDGPREESLVVFVSTGPLPVLSWETSPRLDRGEPRDMATEPRRRGGPVHAVRHVRFSLHPKV